MPGDMVQVLLCLFVCVCGWVEGGWGVGMICLLVQLNNYEFYKQTTCSDMMLHIHLTCEI